MKRRPPVPRRQAMRDVEEAIRWYRVEGGARAALGFIDALERAYRLIGRSPAAGSPRFAVELGIEGLRTWPVPGYPFLVFYVERPDHVDVWRVLHGGRDIPARLQEHGSS